MRSFITYVRSSGGRNNFGRTTVRYRSRPKTLQSKIPFLSFGSGVGSYSKRQRLISSGLSGTYTFCVKNSVKNYAL